MPKQSDINFKAFITEIGNLIDAKNKTQTVLINAYTDEAIKKSESRIKKELRAELASKNDIKDMVRQSDIKDMVRQSDIKDMVRQSDIKDMVRQSDIKDMVTKKDIAELKEEIQKIHTKIDKTKELQKQLDHLKHRLDQMEEVLFNKRPEN
jgi:tRNA C32,U32 (ribose-2'-O)-methylase TrmJ